jgi:hypothetical protein
VGRPLWREVGYVVFSWAYDILLIPFLLLPQPGGSYSCIYFLQEEGSPVIPPGQSVCLGVEPTLWTFVQTLLSFQEFGSVEVEVTLRLTVSQSVSQYVLVSSTLVGLEAEVWSWSHVTTDGKSEGTSWCQAHCGTCNQILILSEFCCLVSVRRPNWVFFPGINQKGLRNVSEDLSQPTPPTPELSCRPTCEWLWFR